MERFCYEQFACFRPVRIGRVDQVHTEFDGAPQDFERVLSIRRPTPNPFPGDAHRAEAEPIDREIGAQFPIGICGRTACSRRCGPGDCTRSSCEKRGSACQSRTKKCSATNTPLLHRFQRFVRHKAQVTFMEAAINASAPFYVGH